ncbi:hypothetical protein AVEN_12198-1 [Araneus ventricosus]|uniref:Uncharacterized protein n=1 Tax=Araneus ventricosus TaxID=182803 RepID=A0A4Y2TB95_ARAVE|nr:hypothetical protein AVEN_12198-1 [Araneus ventricosus]
MDNIIFLVPSEGIVIAIVIDMANLEALQKSWKTDRAAFTKAYNKVKELIALEGVDISKLEAELNVLKVDRLEVSLNFFPRRNLKLLRIFVITLYGLKLKVDGLSIINNIM